MIRKLLIALLAITTVACCAFSFTACGNEDTEQDGDTEKVEKVSGSTGLEYTLSEDGTYYYFSGLGSCTDTEITIANYYNGLPVTQIGKHVITTEEEFKGFGLADLSEEEGMSLLLLYNSNVTSVTISEGITAIGLYAFAGADGCGALKSVSIPNRESISDLHPTNSY